MLSLQAHGRVMTIGGRAMLVARCPLCGREHRYDKGPSGGEEAAELSARGFSDEWLPCQYDLPGNFWRILVGNRSGRGRKPARSGHVAQAPAGAGESRSGERRGDRTRGHGSA
ncbi:MAG TPA: hypothetical protein VFX03_15065 [Thermomicrobiales bacterium]|nr:hypothetical protein [Thermomicrobiales bacterium]